MATVPGDPTVPDNVVDLVPKHLQPNQGDFLMAAAIMQQREQEKEIQQAFETPEQAKQRERDELTEVPESARTPITARGLTYGSRERQQYFQKQQRTIPKEFSLGPEKGEELEEPETYIDPSGRKATRL